MFPGGKFFSPLNMELRSKATGWIEDLPKDKVRIQVSTSQISFTLQSKVLPPEKYPTTAQNAKDMVCLP